MTRKLAAILAADVVGYTSMMARDEAATVAGLKSLRAEVFGPVFADHSGTIVKSMGDGWLVEFSSAVAAVNAAVLVQDRLQTHGNLTLRMGIHIGDIIRDEHDVYGEGINIAARLEGIAPTGGIMISDTVYSGLDGTLSPLFEAAGQRTLKNITRPLTVWARDPNGLGTRLDRVDPQIKTSFPALTITRTAFTDPRPEIEELAHAITADLNGRFSSINWLQTTQDAVPPSQGYTLTPALRARGDRLRLETRLLGPNGSAVWTHKSDSSLDDSFDWQDKVVAEITDYASGMIMEAEVNRLTLLPDADLTAEQCLLIGIMAWRTFEMSAFLRSVTFHDRAITANPGLPDAYAEAIIVLCAARTMTGSAELKAYQAKLPGWLEAARPLAAGHANLTIAIAIATYLQDRRTAPLRQSIAQGMRLAPFDPRILSFAGWGNLWSGQIQEALDCFLKSIDMGRIGPFLVSSLGGAATASIQLGDDAAALTYAEQGLALADSYPTFYSTKAAALALQGRIDEAHAVMRHYRTLEPDRSIKQWREVNPYGGTAEAERYFEGLRLAGLPES